MASARETAVLALIAALDTTGAVVTRDPSLPEIIPPEGLITVSEGDIADIETTMSPLTYHCELAVILEAHVVGRDEHGRDAAMDALLTEISTVVTADRLLGGAAEWAEIGPPDFEAFEADGASKSARVAVTLTFSAVGSPLA